jgi:hypothetical protein
MAYLAEQTGGFAVMNSNDLADGLGRITSDVRDYYVIGYTPQAGTFVGKGKKPSLHKISIRVKRPGLQVKTRKEFLGISDPAESIGPRTAAQELVHAATSPFAETTVALRATTLPGYTPDKGSYVRTLLHIDARGLTFIDDETGKRTASADVLGMVFDQDGIEVAHLSTGILDCLDARGDGRRTPRRSGLHVANPDTPIRRVSGSVCDSRSAVGRDRLCRRVCRGARRRKRCVCALRDCPAKRRAIRSLQASMKPIDFR